MESIHQQSVASQELTEESFQKAAKPTRDFHSEEDMKMYYLQMAEIMGSKSRDKRKDINNLRNLQKRLKQFANALQHLNSHEWERGIVEIQNAAGVYMMQKEIDRNKLLQVNAEIGLHLQFVTQSACDTGVLKQMQGVMLYHLQNVEYLLKKINI